MAVSVDVLKLTQVEGVVCVRGTAATGTIALATTLKKSTETQSSPTVNIKGLQWALSSGASAKIQRNSVTLWELMESGTLDFNGFSDNDENDQDIAVVIAEEVVDQLLLNVPRFLDMVRNNTKMLTET